MFPLPGPSTNSQLTVNDRLLFPDGRSLHFNTDEFTTFVTDTEILFIVTRHFAAPWARRPFLNEPFQIKAFLVLENNGGGNPFAASHAAYMNFFGLGHFEPPHSCL